MKKESVKAFREFCKRHKIKGVTVKDMGQNQKKARIGKWEIKK